MAKEKSAAGGGKLPVVIVNILLVIALIVNVVCIQMFAAINTFMAANLNSHLPGANGSVTAEQLTLEQTKKASLAMAQELAAEGIVLLENRDNALPLAGGAKVNLFGYATVSPLYGGTGSGASDTSANVDLVQGLTNAGLQVNQELVHFYKNSGVKRESQGGFTGSDFTPAAVPAGKYGDSLLANAKAFSDTAVVIFSRIGSEGGDLPMDMEAAGYSQAGGNRSHLELTQDEEDLLELVKTQGFGKGDRAHQLLPRHGVGLPGGRCGRRAVDRRPRQPGHGRGGPGAGRGGEPLRAAPRHLRLRPHHRPCLLERGRLYLQQFGQTQLCGICRGHVRGLSLL